MIAWLKDSSVSVEYHVNTAVDDTQESDSDVSVQPTNLNASRFSEDANGYPPGKESNSMGKLSVSPLVCGATLHLFVVLTPPMFAVERDPNDLETLLKDVWKQEPRCK